MFVSLPTNFTLMCLSLKNRKRYKTLITKNVDQETAQKACCIFRPLSSTVWVN